MKTSVADATFRLFRHATELPPPPGFELRLGQSGERISGGFWRVRTGKFVCGWFHTLAVTQDAWLIAYLPDNCRRFTASLVPFSEVKRLPAILRKAGCRVGSAKLLVQMVQALTPRYSTHSQ